MNVNLSSRRNMQHINFRLGHKQFTTYLNYFIVHTPHYYTKLLQNGVNLRNELKIKLHIAHSCASQFYFNSIIKIYLKYIQ